MNPIVKDNEIKHNYLAAAEMDEEGNYNMIDGVINIIRWFSFFNLKGGILYSQV